MKLSRGVRLSVRALAAHRRRVLLAAGSVALGVAAVLTTSALGQGARAEVVRDIAKMGTNLLVVRPKKVERRPARPTIRGVVTSLRPGDRDEISALPDVRAVAPGRDGTMRVKAGRRSMEALVFGTSPTFSSLRGLRLRSGRFLSPEENRSALRVAVLGGRIAEMLFPGRDPTGAAIRIRGSPFDIVGVLESRGVLADGSDEDGNIFIPVRTALRRVFNSSWLTAVFVSASQPERMDAAEQAIRALLRERHRLHPQAPDDFEIQNQSKLLAMRESLAASLSLLAAGLAGASLLVGGTGILALMYLSVKERTNEIGLRMAVGARRRDVFTQFIAEASLLSMAGWLAGALMASAAIIGFASLTDWPVGVPVGGIIATLGTIGITGIGFGSLPARTAARLPPIEALRAR